ncbi:MAG: DNA-binding protein WhiA [Clostridia bacterium]|nr:DNA-binding protein WhiA [Clostridia bacterium]
MTGADGNTELEEAESKLCKASKEELALKPLASRGEKTAFLSAVIFTSGSLLIHGSRVSASVSTQNEFLAKAVSDAAQSLTGKAAEVSRVGKTSEVLISDAVELLGECRVLNSESWVVCDGIDKALTRERADAAAFVRGAYLGGGSLIVPKYHLEFSFGKKTIAEDFAALILRFGIKTELTAHRGRAVVYTKDSEHISDCLALMGGVKAVLSLNSIIAARQMSAHINRQQNCDMHNIDKQINTGLSQCAYLKELDLSVVSQGLKEAAQMRLAHPDYSYEQLAALLGITKSGLKNRLRRLKEIYERGGV